MKASKIFNADLMYLPPIEFFVAILDAEQIYFDPVAPYLKQTYRNRTRILLSNKVDVLSVPVLSGRRKIPYREVMIDYSQKWKNVHLRGIQSGYGKSPFFEFYFPYFEPVFGKDLTFLWELNWELLTVCLKLLNIPVSIHEMENKDNQQQFEDLRGKIHPKEDFVERPFLSAYPYGQSFGRDFEPNLSVLDLLFCKGPESKEVLNLSKKIG